MESKEEKNPAIPSGQPIKNNLLNANRNFAAYAVKTAERIAAYYGLGGNQEHIASIIEGYCREQGGLVCQAPLWGKSCNERQVDSPCLNCRAFTALEVDAALDDRWATVTSQCGYCGGEVQHVCTAFLKEDGASPSEDHVCDGIFGGPLGHSHNKPCSTCGEYKDGSG